MAQKSAKGYKKWAGEGISEIKMSKFAETTSISP